MAAEDRALSLNFLWEAIARKFLSTETNITALSTNAYRGCSGCEMRNFNSDSFVFGSGLNFTIMTAFATTVISKYNIGASSAM